MPRLTVTEKEHWKDRLAKRIERKIEVLKASDPGLFTRLNREARVQTLQSLGLAELSQRLETIEKRWAMNQPNWNATPWPSRRWPTSSRLFRRSNPLADQNLEGDLMEILIVLAVVAWVAYACYRSGKRPDRRRAMHRPLRQHPVLLRGMIRRRV